MNTKRQNWMTIKTRETHRNLKNITDIGDAPYWKLKNVSCCLCIFDNDVFYYYMINLSFEINCNYLRLILFQNKDLCFDREIKFSLNRLWKTPEIAITASGMRLFHNWFRALWSQNILVNTRSRRDGRLMLIKTDNT